MISKVDKHLFMLLLIICGQQKSYLKSGTLHILESSLWSILTKWNAHAGNGV